MSKHHYAIATEAVDRAVEEASESGWSSADVLQSILVVAIERYGKERGKRDTQSLISMEVSNLRDEVDYDFVRSR